MMDFDKIQALIKLVNETDISEVNIKTEDIKICIRTKHYSNAKQQQTVAMPMSVQSPVPQIMHTPAVNTAVVSNDAASSGNAAEPSSTKEDKYVTFRSPMIGTFYRSPAPDKPPYMKIGDTVEAKSVLCIIEAMKLFNEIEAEINGRIVKILVDDSSPVEYDQPLFLIEPI